MSNRKHMKKSEDMRKRMHARGGAHEKAGVHMRDKKNKCTGRESTQKRVGEEQHKDTR